MNISALFIRRPVMTTLVMFAILLFGIMGYRSLPVSDLPNVDFPTITVSASLPGASPETMATAIATPLEQQFSSIAGIDSMSSSSSLGKVQITLQFALDRDIDAAAQDVQSAISAASRLLPNNMPAPPTFRKLNPSAAPILYLALSSSTYPLSTVNRYAESILAQRISMVSGVAQVNVYGSQKYAVRVQLNPHILGNLGISLDDVATAIKNSNVLLPSGTLNGAQQSFMIQTTGQLANAAAFRPVIVAYRNGAPIRLSAIGNVIDSVENDKVASWLNSQRAIILAIQRQPGTNTIQVVNDIKQLLPVFDHQLPAGIKLDLVYDRSQSIRASVHEVQFTLILAAVLVILVIFVFLQTFSATFIPSIALPLSVMGTFAVMHLLNFSLDNLSLLALTLVVGFVVDDAIVMLENIFRHIELGKPPLIAALDGSKEIGFTILSMTLSLAMVFLPLLFMSGIVGRLFSEFGVTIFVSIILSGFISLTLTPMLCSRFLKSVNHNERTPKRRWQQIAENNFDKLLSFYKTSLQWALDHLRTTLWIFVGSLLLISVLFHIVPKGFLPNEDSGQISAFTEADPAISFAAMAKQQQLLADIVRHDPNVANTISIVGAGGASATANTGRIFIRLKPRNERKLSAEEVLQELRGKFAKVPGINAYLQNISSIVTGPQTKSAYQYTLQNNNIAELDKWAMLFLNEISQLPQLQDVSSNLQFSGPQVIVKIDRDKAAALGVTAAQINTTLGHAFAVQQVSTIFTPLDTYQVIMELEPTYQTKPVDLTQVHIPSSNGKLIPLSAIATITQGAGALTINHQGQLPAVTISFNLKPGVALSEAVAGIQKIKRRLNPPDTMLADFEGTAKTFKDSSQGLGLLVILSILVIYIILGILYESFIHPLTILSGLPAAGVGALLTLLLFHVDLNLYAFIGIIMLIGIVKKNAIMMIDFALAAQREHNMSPAEAIYQACIVRFRPIMMTTVAALLGTLPIALAFGSGAEARKPLGLAVVGGLLVSQLLTLYITPAIYIYFEQLIAKWKASHPKHFS